MLVWHHQGLFRECHTEAGLTSGCIRGRPALPRTVKHVFVPSASGCKQRRELPASLRKATEIYILSYHYCQLTASSG